MSYFGRWSLAKAAANNSLPVVLDLMGISIFVMPETYHWLNYEKGGDSTVVTSRAARFRNTMMKLIVTHDPEELAYCSRHLWTWRSVAEYSSGQKRGSDWCCAVLASVWSTRTVNNKALSDLPAVTKSPLHNITLVDDDPIGVG
ncbi:hypothetical protein T03_14711 [Trichinella britovi]|uniref:Uncharacterized protein n=1 Tax=Trichinella britovi TaxID=45882 RepID=A0A0V1C3Y7_TRIBR|nr:hypothetical protein T03_14711 [Trichinella britovi]